MRRRSRSLCFKWRRFCTRCEKAATGTTSLRERGSTLVKGVGAFRLRVRRPPRGGDSGCLWQQSSIREWELPHRGVCMGNRAEVFARSAFVAFPPLDGEHGRQARDRVNRPGTKERCRYREETSRAISSGKDGSGFELSYFIVAHRNESAWGKVHLPFQQSGNSATGRLSRQTTITSPFSTGSV